MCSAFVNRLSARGFQDELGVSILFLVSYMVRM
jgi:hypothetical protein